MNSRKIYLLAGLIALTVSLLTIGAYQFFGGGQEQRLQIEHIDPNPSLETNYEGKARGSSPAAMLDFTEPAQKVMDAVVHIRSTQRVPAGNRPGPQSPLEEFFDDDFFDQFFRRRNPSQRQQPQPRVGSGSGVIINEQGYIVTNNHVVRNADDIEVTLYDNRNFKARLVGADPNTDMAVLQIKAEDLPTIPFADSDKVEVGQWVLAVGNPFNLNSTVTAGIVSAKARNINILREQYAVESFIQTDAAINRGNSGGALVDLEGGLVGINTAIASPTGAYSGYGFAVPSNIVSKVVQDLIQYGRVQRGYLGVMIRGVNARLAEEENLSVTRGVYVDSLLSNSAAAEAGIQPGDVIVAIEEEDVNSAARLQEIIAQKQPGDQIQVTVLRNGEQKTFEVVLKNRQGETKIAEARDEESLSGRLGATFETLDEQTAEKLGIPGGVRVVNLKDGLIRRQTKMEEGFIITKVDKQTVADKSEFLELLRQKDGGVLMEGVYEDIPGKYYYAVGLQ